MKKVREFTNDDVKFNLIMIFGVTWVSTSHELSNSVLYFRKSNNIITNNISNNNYLFNYILVFKLNPNDLLNLLTSVYPLITTWM